MGRAKLVIDRARDVLVGATFVGAGTAELVHSATVAIIGGVTLSDLWHAVPSYPTVGEVWLRLLEARRSWSTRSGSAADERPHVAVPVRPRPAIAGRRP